MISHGFNAARTACQEGKGLCLILPSMDFLILYVLKSVKV